MNEPRQEPLRGWLQFAISVVGALFVVGAAWASITARLAVIETKLEGVAGLPGKIEHLTIRMVAVERAVDSLQRETQNDRMVPR